MAGAETRLLKQCQLKFANGPTRLWRNPVSMVWVGRKKAILDNGCLLLHPGWSRMQAGLVESSSDVIGIHHGLFVAAELKTRRTATTTGQHAFVDMINHLGGLAGIVRDVDDMEKLLGRYKP